jgi:hypothetical protein
VVTYKTPTSGGISTSNVNSTLAIFKSILSSYTSK